MSLILSILGISTVVWFWMDTLRARELANAAGKRACRTADVQFLDGTVSFARIGLVKHGNVPGLRRVFVFEYSEDGEHRKQGFVIIINGTVVNIGFEARQVH